MICPNCSMNFEDNMMYCPNCGTAVNNSNNNNDNYQQSAPYAQPPYGSTVYYQTQQPEKNPTVGQYVGWMLLGSLLGPISLIISIVFACSSNNKPRANYFKAHLIIMAISIVLSTIVLVAFAFLGLSFADASYDIYSSFMQIAALIV